MAQPETLIVNKILSFLNSLPECKAEKNHGTPYGKPKLDITGAIHGKMFQIEVKCPGKKPTPRQYSVIDAWKAVNVPAGWATNTFEAVKVILPLLTQQDKTTIAGIAKSRKNYGLKQFLEAVEEICNED